MIDNLIGNKTLLPILKRMLDIGTARHKVIAQNISNASTPGYSKKILEFEESLQSMISKNSAGFDPELDKLTRESIGNETQYRIVSSKKKAAAGAVNNVVLSEEMTDLARNQLYYKFAVNMMKRQLAGIKSSISGRSR